MVIKGSAVAIVIAGGAIMDLMRPQDAVRPAPALERQATTMEKLLGDTTTALNGVPKPVSMPVAPVSRLDTSVLPYGPEPRDPGGALPTYYSKILMADMAKQEVRIRGTCVSACTVYLGAKNACVEPDAMLWFHAASVDKIKPDPEATRIMATYWPKPVQDWARQNGVHEALTFTRRRALTGEDLIKMGVRQCA